jgi:AcrR family transcriptional regulator
LILDKGWDAVSVQDVCAHADVGRSTFYSHFADKEDLLLSGFDELHEMMDTERRKAARPFGFAEELIAHAAENARLFRAVVGHQSGVQMQARFRDVVTTLIDQDLGALRHDRSLRASTAGFLAAGFVALLMTWLDRPAGIAAADVAARFRRLAVGALRAAE